MPYWLLPPLVSFCLTGGALWALLRSRLAYGLAMDHPNQRSLHACPVPRIGGLVAVPAAVGCGLAAGASLPLSLSAALLCLLSYVDDRMTLGIGIRLGAHFCAALAVVSLGQHDLPFWIVPVVVLALAWMTNLYNFMDGLDGLAGGMAMFGFGALGAMAVNAGVFELAALSLALAGAASAFLLFNFQPARVFLGDAGSIPMGFLAGAIGIEGIVRGAWPSWFPLLVFSPFIADASVTLLRRAIRGEKVWHAHREHYYQRLVQLGWGHKRVALAEYAVMLSAILLGVFILGASPIVQIEALLAWGLFLGLLMAAIDRRWNGAAVRGESGT